MHTCATSAATKVVAATAASWSVVFDLRTLYSMLLLVRMDVRKVLFTLWVKGCYRASPSSIELSCRLRPAANSHSDSFKMQLFSNVIASLLLVSRDGRRRRTSGHRA